MTFTTEAAKKQIQVNTVVSIDGTWFSKHQVDSDTGDVMGTGSGVPTANVGLLSKPRVSPVKVDFRKATSTTQTLTFELLDKDGLASGFIQGTDNQTLDKDVLFYIGFNNEAGDFDFGDYKLFSKVKVKKIAKKQNIYTFTCTEVTERLTGQMFVEQDKLSADITDADTTLTLLDASAFPASGRIRIDDEFITYSGKSVNDLTGLGRGDQSSDAIEHTEDAVVFLVTDTGAINPITLLLQLIISPGGGGTYDVLDDGLGISETDVDVAEFEAIRTANFSTDEFRFFLHDIGSALPFFETEFLEANNIRFFPKDGKISLTLLDQATTSISNPDIDENTIVKLPRWELGSDRMINRVEFGWNYSEGLKVYSRNNVLENSDSQTDFGVKNPLVFKFKGVLASLSGGTIITDRGTRILARLSTPRGRIIVTTHYSNIEINVGDNVNLTHRYLPSQGGGLGMVNEVLEVVSKAVDFENGIITFNLEYTSFSGVRVGLIAPSPLISSVTSQTVFDVPDGSCYQAGDFLRLWDDSTSTYYADPVNEILSVVGNTITMSVAWVTVLTTSVRVKFAEYEDTSGIQKGGFAFVSEDVAPFFPDNSNFYGITV